MSLKSVLITGCSAGGIGGAIAVVLAKQGHHIFATARNTSKIPKELTHLSNVTILSLDVTSPSSIAEAVKAVGESGHGLDVLVNNAGHGYPSPVLDVDIEKARELYETNVFACIRLIQAFVDLLIASHGRIVNLSTVAATVNMPWISTYASSKAALAQLSETLRLELAPFGVSVVTIMGGVITSKFDDNTELKLPPDSRYAPIESFIAGWASGKSKPKGSTVEEFAREVVGDIVGGGKGGKTYRGATATAAQVLVGWFPQFLTASGRDPETDIVFRRGQANWGRI